MTTTRTSTGKIFHDRCIDLATEGWQWPTIGSKYAAADTWLWNGRSAVADYVYKSLPANLTTCVLNYFMSSNQASSTAHYAPRVYVTAMPGAAYADMLFYDYGTPDATTTKHRLGYFKGGVLTAFTGSPYNAPSTGLIPYKLTLAGANIALYCNRSLLDSRADSRVEGMKSFVFGNENPDNVYGAGANPITGYSEIVLSSSNIITVTGLGASSGRKVKLYRGIGTLVATSGAADGSGQVAFDAVDFQFGEYGFLVITDTDGTTAVDISDSFQIYGGDVFAWANSGTSTSLRIVNAENLLFGEARLHTPYLNASLDHFRILRANASGGTFRPGRTYTDNFGDDLIPVGLLLDQSVTPVLDTTQTLSSGNVVNIAFTPGISGSLAGMGVPAYWNSGSNSIISWKLYLGDGSGNPTGGVLASRDWCDVDDLDATANNYEFFGFDSDYAVTAAQQYVVQWKVESGGGQVIFQKNTVSGFAYKTYIRTPEKWGDTVYYKVQAEDAANTVLATSAEYEVTTGITPQSIIDRIVELFYALQVESYGITYSATTVFNNTKDAVWGRYPMFTAFGMMFASTIYKGTKLSSANILTAGNNQGAYAISSMFNDAKANGKLFKDMTGTPTEYYREQNARNAICAYLAYRLTNDTTYLQYAIDIAKGMANYFLRENYTYNGVTELTFHGAYNITTLVGTGKNNDPNQNWQVALLFALLYYDSWASNPFYKGNSVAVDNPNSYAYWSGKTYATAASEIVNAEMACGFSLQESSGRYRIRLQSVSYPYVSEMSYGRFGLSQMCTLFSVANATDFSNLPTWKTNFNNAVDNWLTPGMVRPQWEIDGYTTNEIATFAAFAIPIAAYRSADGRYDFVRDLIYSRTMLTEFGLAGIYDPSGITTSYSSASVFTAGYQFTCLAMSYLYTPEAEWLLTLPNTNSAFLMFF